jgi:hypothetical protein
MKSSPVEMRGAFLFSFFFFFFFFNVYSFFHRGYRFDVAIRCLRVMVVRLLCNQIGYEVD